MRRRYSKPILCHYCQKTKCTTMCEECKLTVCHSCLTLCNQCQNLICSKCKKTSGTGSKFCISCAAVY